MGRNLYYNSKAQVEALLHGKERRNIPSIRDTAVSKYPDGSLNVRYQWTNVVTYNPDGTVTLRNGGYRTHTTKHRINGFSPFSVYQRDWDWFISLPGGDVPFRSGITLDPRTMTVVEK